MPLFVLSVKVIVKPKQTVDEPTITAGKGFTFKRKDLLHPVAKLKVSVSVPAPTP